MTSLAPNDRRLVGLPDLLRDVREALGDGIADCAEEIAPPSPTVIAYLEDGDFERAARQYRVELGAALMGITPIEFARRYPRNPPQPKTGRVVYFISTSPRPLVGAFVKIGVATNVSSRLATMRVDNPHDLYLLGTCEGGLRLEKELHARFAADHHRGEWFRVTRALAAYIEENAT